MRRRLIITTIAALSLAACGSSDGDSAKTETTEVAATEATGSDSDAEDEATTTTEAAPTTTEAALEKPEVELPEELPTELVRTVLKEGTGDEAEEGDTVVVHYVGVRSADGVEFDNSYDRGQPFPVVLGSGSVIQGWEQGLVGSRTGERVQLDIPAELAYGDQARSDVIVPNTPLTFVIDVQEVLAPIDPEDIPSEPGIPLTDIGVEATTFATLEEGDGDELAIGDVAEIRYVYFRADNGVPLETNWATSPFQVPYTEDLLPGLLEGMEGMVVGERRAITIPPEDGFGPEGNPSGGLPAETDIVFVIELVGIA